MTSDAQSSGLRNASNSWPHILLLRTKGASPIVTTFERMLRDTQRLHIKEVDDQITEDGLDAICCAIETLKPALLVLSGDEVSEALRFLNHWNSQTRAFHPAFEGENKPRFVVTLPSLTSGTLFDLAAGSAVDEAWWAVFATEWNYHRTSPISNDDFEIRTRSVRKALLAAFAARARHSIQFSVGTDTHGQNDAVAAIRILQGAAIDGVNLENKRGEAFTDADVLAIAREIDPNAKVADGWDRTDFFALAAKIVRTSTNKVEKSFASILMVDDRGFWAEAFNPIGARLGLRIKSMTCRAELFTIPQKSENRVRAVILDMRLGSDEFGGARLIPALRGNFPDAPILVLSVDDRFSESALLRRMGVFAYINKHSLAEPHHRRDAVSAFRQVEDAVLAAGFASLAGDLRVVLTGVVAAWKRMMAPSGDRDQSFSLFRTALNRALDALIEECRRTFHGLWQDTGFSEGLSCRQVIRAFGVVNDKWCSIWKTQYFDPDYSDQCWQYPINIQNPFQKYHRIATILRGEASHGKVEDHQFRWLDVWIMILTFALKVEGTCRGYLHHIGGRDGREWDEFNGTVTASVSDFARCLGGLMSLVLEDDQLQVNKASADVQSQNALSNAAKQLDARLREYEPPLGTEAFPEGDERRLSIGTYQVSGSAKVFGQMEYIFDQRNPYWQTAPSEMMAAHILLLRLILQRVPNAKSPAFRKDLATHQ